MVYIIYYNIYVSFIAIVLILKIDKFHFVSMELSMALRSSFLGCERMTA